MWSVLTGPCLVETVVPSISGKQVALHALARHVTGDAAVARADFVELVEKDDAVIFHRVNGILHELLLIEQLVGFLVEQDVVRFLDGDAARFWASAELAENVADRDGADLRARHAGNLEERHAAPAPGLHLDLDLLVVELARAQLAPEGVLGGGAGTGAGERVDHALFSCQLCARGHVLSPFVARLPDRDLDEVAHDLLDVAADIADLSEFGGFDFQERRAGKPCQAPRNLGLADASRPDHQDVLRQHLFAHAVVKLQPPPAVAQRDCDRALGVVLADDEAVELGNDFAGREVAHASRTIRRARPSGVSTTRSPRNPAFS